MRTVVVDWSGRRHGERRAMALAEVAADDGHLVRVEQGRSRAEIAEHLCELAADDPRLVVGLDFSFSLPAWFLHRAGYLGVEDLWTAATAHAETWLAECRPPFWGRRGRPRPELPAHFRQTELTVGAVGGIRPKSTFQIAGAGSVGAGSLRGFPVLALLRAAGFAVWPFDDARPPVLVEVWPRLLTGPVVKSDPAARATALERLPGLPAAQLQAAAANEDAFDAAVGALVLARHAHTLVARERRDDPWARLEGEIWVPPGDRQASRGTGRHPSPSA